MDTIGTSAGAFTVTDHLVGTTFIVVVGAYSFGALKPGTLRGVGTTIAGGGVFPYWCPARRWIVRVRA